MKNEVGEVRPGQLITTYGPGAVMDSINDSLVVLDINYWEKANEIIHDRRLAGFLKKDYFKKIPSTGKFDLPAIPFPNYHVCSNNKCRRLFDIRDNFNMQRYLANGPQCPECNWKSHPARFVVSCDAENHLDDFPWKWWAHRKSETSCNGKMKLNSSGNNSGLSSLVVECECGSWNDMSAATQKQSFKDYKCTGNHPHKLNKKSKCVSDVIPLQRGASNVYFSVLRSAISIPEDTSEKIKILSEYAKDIQEDEEDFGERGLKRVFKRRLEETNVFDSYEEFKECWKMYKNLQHEEVNRYEEIKEIEYEAFTKFKDKVIKQDFQAEVEKVPSDLSKYFSRIVKAHRLKEILVLLGFTRNESPEPEVKEPSSIVWLGNGINTNWLPAVEVHGEGIFLEFNREALDSWLNENKEVFSRSEKYRSMYHKWLDKKGWTNQRDKDAIYVLLHTFSHLLMKQLSHQSGYSSASIKERIYYNDKMVGILLYTGSTDQEGSLGGLVEMGEISKLRKLIIDALEESTFCSNDPNCSVQEPSDDNYLNGASCFACTMLAETSCETGNMLLDRSFLITTMESEITPFFEGLI
ncbi:DrmB family protein [Brevibacillus laterosporus]|uniref:DrmB family protein n=1 Tax=Brevibacillus laterosporus TaxID=1465 RepID=UPI000B9B11AE|nr:DrmB family protein [Brevibacillus laterosporus]